MTDYPITKEQAAKVTEDLCAEIGVFQTLRLLEEINEAVNGLSSKEIETLYVADSTDFNSTDFRFFRCCRASSSKPSVEMCEDGEAAVMPCAICGSPALVCMNQQLAISKDPTIKILDYECADRLRR